MPLILALSPRILAVVVINVWRSRAWEKGTCNWIQDSLGYTVTAGPKLGQPEFWKCGNSDPHNAFVMTAHNRGSSAAASEISMSSHPPFNPIGLSYSLHMRHLNPPSTDSWERHL